MKPEGSFPRSEDLATRPYPKPQEPQPISWRSV